jgi:Methyltransferase domain
MPVELDNWMTRLEARHLANLQFAEVSRALRALSSAYVERRETAIAAGRVTDTVGKRAAFALYYGPLHFVATQEVLAALSVPRETPDLSRPVVDLGCGTGAVGAAVASWTGARRMHGIDVHPWALEEARATYACFGLNATVTRASVARVRRPSTPSCLVAGYVANERAPRRGPARVRRAGPRTAFWSRSALVARVGRGVHTARRPRRLLGAGPAATRSDTAPG